MVRVAKTFCVNIVKSKKTGRKYFDFTNHYIDTKTGEKKLPVEFETGELEFEFEEKFGD